MKTDETKALEIYEFFRSGFGSVKPPTPAGEIEEVEKRLGRRLPPILRELYKLSDGLTSATFEPCLVQLFGTEHSLEAYTSIFREFAPREEADQYIAFGFTEGWRWWAMREYGDGLLRIITFDPGSFGELKELGPDLFLAYLALAEWKKSVEL